MSKAITGAALDWILMFYIANGWVGRDGDTLGQYSTAFGRRLQRHPLVCKRSWVLLTLSNFVGMSCLRDTVILTIPRRLAICPHTTTSLRRSARLSVIVAVVRAKSLVVFLPDTMYCDVSPVRRYALRWAVSPCPLFL